MTTPLNLRSETIALGVAMAALTLNACAETPHYVAPQLPPNQLAQITLDSRAKVLTLEDLPVTGGSVTSRSLAEHEDSGDSLYVEPGCRTLTAKYEESYFIWGEKKASKAGVGSSLSASLANTETHDYETTQPIRFNFDAKPGYKYWVTASFTGDQFLPRLVEIEPSGESSHTYLPDAACGKPASP